MAANLRFMDAPPLSDLWPIDIAIAPDRRLLVVLFEGGERHALSAEYLRVTSPSAEVQGHSAAERRTVPGKKDVTIKDVKPIGNYAIRIVFSDGHDSGLFTWSYLGQLGRDEERLFAAYLAELEAKGLTRG
jgi:DUF971 family protein